MRYAKGQVFEIGA